jgi:hypothetical protein
VNAGESVLFEIAAHYTLLSINPPSEPLSTFIPKYQFYGMYNPLKNPNNKYGFLDICNYEQLLSIGIHIDQLPQLADLVQPIHLQLLATDFPSTNIILKIIPDSQRGFKIEMVVESS